MNHSFELGKKQTQKDRDHKAHNTKRCILIVLSISMLVFLLIPFTAIRIVSAQPSAVTNPATNVTDTSAVLNGVVATNGQDTFWMFTVELDGMFVQNCPSGNLQFVPANVGTQPVTCQASQLQPSTTYFFALQVCWQPSGTCGNEIPLSFTTSTTTYTVNTIYTNILTITKSSGTSTTSQPMGPGFDFALAVSPSTVSVQQGGTAHYTVQVQYSDPSYYGTMINLQLTGLGPGMSWQVTPAGDLAITTLASTPTGSYALSLTGSANGVAHQTGVTLIVTGAQPATTAVTTTTALTTTASPATTATSSAPFDYSITVSPSTQSAERGGSVAYVVSVLPLSGSPVPVSLTLMGCPSDVHNGFTVQSGNPPYTSTLNLDLSTTSANAGAYTLTVVATAGGNVKTATATLMIQEKAAQTTVAQTTTTSGSNWSDVLQQNSLLIMAALLALAVVFAVLTMRGRGQRAAPQQMEPSRVFCGKCGTGNPATNEFCRSCGNKLKSSQVSEAA